MTSGVDDGCCCCCCCCCLHPPSSHQSQPQCPTPLLQSISNREEQHATVNSNHRLTVLHVSILAPPLCPSFVRPLLQYADGEEVTLWYNKVGPYHNPQETYAYSSLPWSHTHALTCTHTNAVTQLHGCLRREQRSQLMHLLSKSAGVLVSRTHARHQPQTV